MISYEQDPDFFQWGLELFDGGPFPNCGYSGMPLQSDVDYCQDQYSKEENNDTQLGNIGYEFLAHALQQQLLQLAVGESPQHSQEWVENFELPVIPVGNCGPGQESDQEDGDDLEPSSSYSGPDGDLYCGDHGFYSLEHMDEHTLDGEVGKRLNQMVPIPHVPKINGEIPSVDEVTLDHQRLLDRLQAYELVESRVQGDGNCQFRALSDQIYQTSEHHKFVREQVVNQLKSYPEIYEGYVPMAYQDYLEKMSKSGEWGDHVTLQAAADTYGVKMFVITSFKDTCYIEILPHVERSKRVMFLSFWAEVHYNSIYPDGGIQADL